MPTDLRSITDFDGLLAYLGSELDWPVEDYTREELTFEYDADELGLKDEEVAKLSHGTIQQLRPLQGQQPFGIFFVEFDHAKLPIVVLRRILSQLVIKKRSSANSAEAKRWDVSDLIFISAFGEEEHREIAFAHFHSDPETTDLPVLRVLGWHGDDTHLKSAAVAKTLKNRLSWPEDDGDQEAWRQQWRSAFKHKPGHTIRTAKELATAMAGFARRIRDAARAILPYESENGRLRKLYKGFQDALIHDLSHEDFTTYYAETICYGLFTVAVSKTELSEGKYGTAMSADDVAHFVPVTNPFLKEMLWSFLEAGGRNQELNFDDLGINEIVSFFNSSETDLPAVIRDFGSKRPGEDPVIHLYEDFLKQFDAELRKKRGVYYTPKPVVSYIVRSVHELLQTEFGLKDGLADTTTWGEMLGKRAGLELPTTFDDKNREHPISRDEPFVQILDPATGTATFLVEGIEVIHKHLVAKWKQQGLTGAQQLSAWNDYVPRQLLPRLYGYELMMAPYAIAHMKIGLKLAETGYQFGTEERARIYLTNALEPWIQQLPLIGFDALANEATAVNEVKRHKRFTVIMGNPPYSNFGQLNKNPFILGLLEEYKRGLNERKLNLDDDFIKFLRFSQHLLDKSNVGVLGMITNNVYLDGLTHRRIRESLAESFQVLRVLDLHGSSIKVERSPDGSKDENVFDIQQGVGIGVFCKLGQTSSSTAIWHSDLWGLRTRKYKVLERLKVSDDSWKLLEAKSPYYFFVPIDFALEEEYRPGWSTSDMFLLSGQGIETKRDALTIRFTSGQVEESLEDLRSGSKGAVKSKYYLPEDGRDWAYDWAKEDVIKSSGQIVEIAYRPFDYRFTYFTGKTKGFIAYPRTTVSRCLLTNMNYGLVVNRFVKLDNYAHVFVTRGLIERHLLDTANACLVVYPLFAPDSEECDMLKFEGDSTQLNLSKAFLSAVGKSLGLELVGSRRLPSGLTAANIFHYGYAVFNSPNYRSRYAEFLKIDFPRLPLTGSLKLFRELARLGGDLTALHLLEATALNNPTTRFIGNNRQVSKIGWTHDDGGTVWLDGKGAKGNYQPGTSGFSPVPEEVWNIYIGGHQVCDKWLKDRGSKRGQPGRTLSDDDIAHYHKIVVALTETIRLMAEIDEVIETHGGWPGAFSAKDSSAKAAKP